MLLTHIDGSRAIYRQGREMSIFLVPYVPQTAMKNKKTTTPTQGGPFALLPYAWHLMVRRQIGLRPSSAL